MSDEWEEGIGHTRRSPELQRLEAVLRSSKFASRGYLGSDRRYVEDVIETDARRVFERGYTISRVARRMRQITEIARRGLETTVQIEDGLVGEVTEVRGKVPCPWPHPGLYNKTVTTVTRTDNGKTIRWSDLSIHMIEAHGFFEGKGAFFRVEPDDLIDVIFGVGRGEGDELG